MAVPVRAQQLVRVGPEPEADQQSALGPVLCPRCPDIQARRKNRRKLKFYEQISVCFFSGRGRGGWSGEKTLSSELDGGSAWIKADL